MSDLKLYDIPGKFEELMKKAEAGELTQEEYDNLGEQIALELQQKSTNIIGFWQNKNSFIDAVDTQIKRLQEIKKVEQNNLEKFEKYVKDNMERMGITKIETELGALQIIKNPASVVVVDQEQVPDQFLRVKTSIEVDKKAIKDYFKETKKVPDGIKIVTDNTSLRIK